MFQVIKLCLLGFAISCLSAGCEKQGAMGPQGTEGAKGAQGERGDRGEAGEKGANGDRGATGAAGAKGPEGIRGDTGLQGPAGPPGATGERGPSNVIYSDWIDPASLLTTTDGRLEINAPKLTAEILDQGEVYVYLRNPSSTTGTVYLLDGYAHSYWNFRYTLGTGKIWIETYEMFSKRAPGATESGAKLLAALCKTMAVSKPGLLGVASIYAAFSMQEADPIRRYEYRYVLIPGGTPGVSAINPRDYQSISRAFQLEN